MFLHITLLNVYLYLLELAEYLFYCLNDTISDRQNMVLRHLLGKFATLLRIDEHEIHAL